MAKRTRGSSRPGQRRPVQRGSAKVAPRPPIRRTDTLSEEEEARAAELEEQIVARERSAEQARSRPRDRDRVREDAGARHLRRTGQSILEARGAEEYGYVVRDVRRIVVVATALLAVMAVLYVVINVAHVVNIGG